MDVIECFTQYYEQAPAGPSTTTFLTPCLWAADTSKYSGNSTEQSSIMLQRLKCVRMFDNFCNQ